MSELFSHTLYVTLHNDIKFQDSVLHSSNVRECTDIKSTKGENLQSDIIQKLSR